MYKNKRGRPETSVSGEGMGEWSDNDRYSRWKQNRSNVWICTVTDVLPKMGIEMRGGGKNYEPLA